MYPDVIERINRRKKECDKEKGIKFLRAKYLSLTYFHWKNLFDFKRQKKLIFAKILNKHFSRRKLDTFFRIRMHSDTIKRARK